MTRYQPTARSLNTHPVPKWFEDAKLGIFIHWGLFAVPGFALPIDHVSDSVTRHYRLSAVMTPYTEWYQNAIRVPESPSAKHHAEQWGGRPYDDFRATFSKGLERWDPASWARLFKRAGARYVVMVTKHHDGYCLWPSKVENIHRSGWATERDVVGDLAAAVRAEGIRFGVYYSGGIDWSFNKRPVRTIVEFIGSTPTGDYPGYADAQVRELVERYEPSVLWNDISWPTGLPSLLRLVADYYDAVPEGVINDRWMHRNWMLKAVSLAPVQRVLDNWIERRIRREVEAGRFKPGIVPPPPIHYDFRTPEYTSFDEIGRRKWEATRGMSPSFGFNRADREENYEAPEDLIRSFIDTVSKNGNLLLNVGPTGEDASIPSFQKDRLEQLGDWLDADGEAIYGTRPWTAAESETRDGLPVRFTRKGEVIYAILLGQPTGSTIEFGLPSDLPGTLRIREVRNDAIIEGSAAGRTLTLKLPSKLVDAPAHAFSLCG